MPTGSSNSRVVWDDATEKHLLILILLQCKPAVNWDIVARKFGQGTTPGALSQKYQKIRKRDATLYGMEDGFDANGTPREPISGTSTPKSTGKRRRGAKDFDSATDDDETSESPTKKIKAAKAKKNALAGVAKGSSVSIKQERASERADSEATTIKKEAYGTTIGGDGDEMEHEHVELYDMDNEA